jgi:hypothetical protein
MNLAKVFVLTMAAGGAGGALGSMLGSAMGRGGLLAGGFLGGVSFVVGAGFVSMRWGWILPAQRLWVILGGVFGFTLACIVALATISSPVGPVLSTLLVGTGAVLGAVVGKSPHTES